MVCSRAYFGQNGTLNGGGRGGRGRAPDPPLLSFVISSNTGLYLTTCLLSVIMVNQSFCILVLL